MSEKKPDKRTGERRQGDDPDYQGDERRKGERRDSKPPGSDPKT